MRRRLCITRSQEPYASDVRLHDLIMLWTAAGSLFGSVEVAIPAMAGIGNLVVLGFSAMLIAGFLVLFVV